MRIVDPDRWLLEKIEHLSWWIAKKSKGYKKNNFELARIASWILAISILICSSIASSSLFDLIYDTAMAFVIWIGLEFSIKDTLERMVNLANGTINPNKRDGHIKIVRVVAGLLLFVMIIVLSGAWLKFWPNPSKSIFFYISVLIPFTAFIYLFSCNPPSRNT